MDCFLLSGEVVDDRVRQEVTSMAQLAINASPFECRWIKAGTEMRLEQFTYAICLRCVNHSRVVSEDECFSCACWEPRIEGPREGDEWRL